MTSIQGVRIRNYRSLKNITIGKLWNIQDAAPLTPLTAVIGRNGVGKSTLFDAFGFLVDCLKLGVEEACDARGRGGFERIRSQGENGPLEFEVYYKQDNNSRPITYELKITMDDDKRPYVQYERLRQRRKGQKHGKPCSFLFMEDGKGYAWTGPQATANDVDDNALEARGTLESRMESSDVEFVELDDIRRLGIVTLGSLKGHPRIAAFRRFLEGWYLSYFTPDAARGLPLAGPQPHLNMHGDNLGNVVQYMERHNRDRFNRILHRIAEKIPGIDKIDTEKTSDGRLLLRFNDRGFQDPFFAQQMSDGTLKLFAYMLLLEDPTPPPFICIEEPENGLYHKLLEALANEFREHASGRKGSPQLFITTHQPYFVNALTPEEVWLLEKGTDGFSVITRASENELVKNLVAEGLELGNLWYSEYLDAG